MREATKHTDDEEKIVPRPEGYTIVKCAKGWAWFTVVHSLILAWIVAFAVYQIGSLVI